MAAKPLVFSGQEEFAVAPERLYDVVTDLDILAASIPDLESSHRVDDTTLACTIRPGFSFLRGKLDVEVKLVDLERPQRATMQVHARGIGATIEVVSKLEISGGDSASQLDWSAEVTRLKGLVATVSQPLIQAAAGDVIRGAWQALRERVEGS